MDAFNEGGRGFGADGATNQSRREALKRFGRFAAVAPTAMVLLQPREGQAKRRKGRGRGGGGGWGGRGESSHY